MLEGRRIGVQDGTVHIGLAVKSPPTPPTINARIEVVLVLVLVLIGTLRIVSTYRIFSHTYDEPGHIA